MATATDALHLKAARITGLLFIIGFAGIVTAVLTKPILDSPDYLTKISANQNPFLIGALFQFVMGAACAGIGISLYPILRRYSERLALGAVGFRLIEAVFQIFGVVILLLLFTLSREFVKNGASGSSYFQTAGLLLQAGNAWVNHVAVTLAWCLGALMYYFIFYRTKLIPRWLSVWGLAGITLTFIASILVMVGRISPFSTIELVLNFPIAMQELVLAVWLLLKGFNTSVLVPETIGRAE